MDSLGLSLTLSATNTLKTKYIMLNYSSATTALKHMFILALSFTCLEIGS